MSNTNNHPWSRDPVAQAAVRAAEDDAANWRRLEPLEVVRDGDQFLSDAGVWITVRQHGDVVTVSRPVRRRRVQPPEHRELPQAVAELRERVARLEAAVIPKSVSVSNAEVHENKGCTMPSGGLRTERVTLEITQRVEDYVAPSRWNWCRQLGSHAQTGESVRVVEETTIGSGDVFRDVGCGTTGDEIARLTAERDAALRERDAARAECERLRRPATWQEEEAAVEGAWLLCGLKPDWPSDEPGTIVRHAESMRREIGRLRDRVAELENAAAPAANAGGEQQERMTPCSSTVEREMSGDASCRVLPLSGGDPGSTPGMAIAGGESNQPQPPRGWLTKDEREEVQSARLHLSNSDWLDEATERQCKWAKWASDVFGRLLARETPPSVKLPREVAITHAEGAQMVYDAISVRIAIREAGVEVEE